MNETVNFERMITYLKVRNLAIVEELSIEPGPGLNVLTGETGAGKSLLIDSLEFLRGARSSAEMIRSGADKMSFLEHLDELRRRIVYSLISLVAGIIVACLFIYQLKDFVMAPMYTALQTTTRESATAQIRAAKRRDATSRRMTLTAAKIAAGATSARTSSRAT